MSIEWATPRAIDAVAGQTWRNVTQKALEENKFPYTGPVRPSGARECRVLEEDDRWPLQNGKREIPRKVVNWLIASRALVLYGQHIQITKIEPRDKSSIYDVTVDRTKRSQKA